MDFQCNFSQTNAYLFLFRALFVDFNFKLLSGVISSRLLLLVLACTESVGFTFVSRSIDIFPESFILFVSHFKHFFYAKYTFSCWMLDEQTISVFMCQLVVIDTYKCHWTDVKKSAIFRYCCVMTLINAIYWKVCEMWQHFAIVMSKTWNLFNFFELQKFIRSKWNFESRQLSYLIQRLKLKLIF